MNALNDMVVTAPALCVEDLQVRYGKHSVLKGVSLTVRAGEAHCLLGANGAGKTTLLRTILGRIKPVFGQVHLGTGGVGLVPQDIALFPRLTVRENLSVFARLSGVPRKAIAARVAETAELSGIASRLKARVEDLSGGWQRRVNIASALLGRPALLILDESTVGVDPAARADLHDLIRSLCAEGMGVLMTTHDLAEAEAVCTHVVVLAEGRIELSGPIHGLIQAEFGDSFLLYLTLGPGTDAEARGYVTELGFHVSEGTAIGLVQDERHGLSLVSQLRQVGLALSSVRLERPGLSALYDQNQGAA